MTGRTLPRSRLPFRRPAASRPLAVWALAAVVSFLAPTVAESVLAVAGETETVFEDGLEGLANPADLRDRRRRRPVPAGTVATAQIFARDARRHLATPFNLVGHRLTNGLLAPLRC